jgi:hypothetical protein
MHNSLLFTQLFTAKICHDLATPLSAISLSLEMSEPGSALDTDTYKILHSSGEDGKFKLSIYRSLLSASPSAPGFSEVATLLRGYGAAHNISFEFPSMVNISEGEESKFFLGLMFMVAKSLSRGGAITLTETARGWALDISGSFAQIKNHEWEALTQPGKLEDQSARTILAYYLGGLLLKWGWLAEKSEDLSGKIGIEIFNSR